MRFERTAMVVTIISAAFTATGVYYYFHGEFARANYWMITVLIVETVLMRLSR